MDIIEPKRNADFEWATRLNRIMLNIVGIWPRAHKNTYDKFLSNIRATFTLIVLIFIGAIPGLHSLLRIWGDLLAMIDNLQYTLPILITVMKLIVIWWKKTDLLMTLNMIAADWIKVKTSKERCIMIKQAQNSRILIMLGYALMIFAIILVVILPCFNKSVRYITNITDPDKLLPLQTHYIYDKTRSPYFEFTYVAQTITVIVCAACYSGVDNLLGLLIFHLCGQLENLKEKLINIKQFENYNNHVAFVVREHIRLIQCFHVIENTFTLLLLGLLIYFSLLFCLYGFLTVAILTEGKRMSIMRFAHLMSVVINVSGHMCLFCAVGEILVAKCIAIHQAAYESKWYEMKSKKAKVLLLIMVRANKPLYITAGKIFPMTMSTFCNLIKTSAGYTSVLLAMQS